MSLGRAGQIGAGSNRGDCPLSIAHSFIYLFIKQFGFIRDRINCIFDIASMTIIIAVLTEAKD